VYGRKVAAQGANLFRRTGRVSLDSHWARNRGVSQKQFIWDDDDLFPADFSEKLRKTLWSQEFALAYRPYETLFAYGPYGEWLLRKNGDAGQRDAHRAGDDYRPRIGLDPQPPYRQHLLAERCTGGVYLSAA